MNRTVLICGASIAGPSLAYWLSRHGFQVTVVEKASALRGGGYAVDIRGTALSVADRMGLIPQLREAHVGTQKLSFLAPDGTLIGSVTPDALSGDPENQDLEVRRGDLAEILYAPLRDQIEFVFNDSIATRDDDGDRVQVTFDSGIRRDFDLVIGADGLHSRTRRLVFGPEEPFHRYLGYTFALFSLPNGFGLSHEGVLWNVPGKAAVLYAHEPNDRVFGLLAFTREDPPFDAFRDP
jgi:2-polyprenyl-6-methoxyphenol hydroxylase-like FAD-dependent oxidoreductase